MSEDYDRDVQTLSSATSTRIDSAHSVHDEEPPHEQASSPPAELVDAIAGRNQEQRAEQLRRQASELAAHLRTQQRSLDHREAEYNSRVAQLENELRVTRLLVREREQELADRELEFRQRTAELEVRSVDLAAAETALDQQWEGQAAAGLKQGNFDPESGQPKSRQLLLDESEAMVRQQLSDLEQQRRDLEEKRENLESQTRSSLLRLQQAKKATETDAEKQRQTVEEHRRALEKRQIALEQLHEDVARMHREALEMRLCTEQLWAELTENVSPAELTRRLGQLRSRLTEHFELANQSLAQQREELQALAARLGQQQKRIEQQRSDLQRWASQREQVIEEQAERLVAREQELDGKELEIQRREEQWDAQRREYQEEIRRLMAKLREAMTTRAA